MAIVVVDAGHGGSDPGAMNGDRKEAHDNLRLALEVGNNLKRCGVDVVFTRMTDHFVTLVDRSIMSNNAHANAFVSLHRNANDNTAANGVEVHVYTSPSEKSISLASNILSRVAATGVQNNRGILRNNFAVLRNTNAPAVLVEMGFITNDEDNRFFDQKLTAYADAIAEGVMATLGIKCDEPTAPAENIIRDIQLNLNSMWNAGIKVDGKWGPASRRALIKALQLQLNEDFGAGLVADGLWGPKTQQALRYLQRGDRGNLVYLLQVALYTHGMTDLIPLDGQFGPATEAAVKAFQQQIGVPVDGIAGFAVQNALFKS